MRSHLYSKNLKKSIFPEMREYLVNLFSHNGVDSVFSGHVHFENFDIEEHKGIRRGSNRKWTGSTNSNGSSYPNGSSPKLPEMELMKDNMSWLQSTTKILGIQKKLKKIMVHVPQPMVQNSYGQPHYTIVHYSNDSLVLMIWYDSYHMSHIWTFYQHITKFMSRMESQLMSKSCPSSKIQFNPARILEKIQSSNDIWSTQINFKQSLYLNRPLGDKSYNFCQGFRYE